MDNVCYMVITGMRRVGKSTLLLQIQDELMLRSVKPEQIISLNFELIGFSDLKNANSLYQYISSRNRTAGLIH